MVSLASIPNELKDAVIIYLDSRDVISLSETCKALRKVTLPVVLGHITMIWDYEASSQRATSPRIISLLRTLLQDPSLALHVKSLTFSALNYTRALCHKSIGNEWKQFEVSRPLNHHVIEEHDGALLEKAIVMSQLPNARDWRQAVISKNDLGAIIALLIMHCIRIQSLTIDFDLLLNNPWFPKMLKHVLTVPDAARESLKFERLVQVQFNDSQSHPGENSLPSDSALLLFHLPKIASIDVVAAPDYRSKDELDDSRGLIGPFWPLRSPPNASLLKTLRLCRTHMPVSSLNLILRQTPHLCSLTFDWYIPSSYGATNLRAISHALCHVRGTLAHLTIRYDRWANEAADPESLVRVVNSSLGSLRHMAVLTELELSFGVLYGQDLLPRAAPPLFAMLPPSLISLTINDDLWAYNAFSHWDRSRMMRWLRAFIDKSAAAKSGWTIATPKFKKLVMHISTEDVESWELCGQEEDKQNLRRLCESQGLSFHIQDRNPS